MIYVLYCTIVMEDLQIDVQYIIHKYIHESYIAVVAYFIKKEVLLHDMRIKRQGYSFFRVYEPYFCEKWYERFLGNKKVIDELNLITQSNKVLLGKVYGI